MISSNTRASRSRFSSPAQNGTGGGTPGSGLVESSRTSGNEGSRAFMQRWLEPEVQNKATFEEAGFSRFGVLENMQPLGAFPKGKKHNGLGLEPGKERTPKIVLKSSNSANGGGGAAASNPAREKGHATSHSLDPTKKEHPSISPTLPTSPTRQPLPPKNLPPKLSAPTSEVRGILPELAPPRLTTTRRSLSLRDLEDANYEASNVRSQPQTRLRTPMSRRGSRPSAGRTSALILTPTGSTVGIMSTGGTDANDDVARVVREAIVQALRFYRYPTAWALEKLWEERSSDPNFVSMVEDVFYQRADTDSFHEFATLVSQKKRQGKTENKACYHFVHATTGDCGRVVVHSPKPAPFGNLIISDTPSQNADTDAHVHKRIKSSHHQDSPSMLRSRRKERDLDEDLEEGGKFSTPKASGRRRRSDSQSSDSSLSSAISLSSPEMHTTSASRRGKFRRARDSPFAFRGHVNKDHVGLSATGPSGGAVHGGGLAGGAAEAAEESYGETRRGAAPSRSEPIAGAGKTLDSQHSYSAHSPAGQVPVQSAPAFKKQNRDHNTAFPMPPSPTHPGHTSHDAAHMPGVVEALAVPGFFGTKSASLSASRIDAALGYGMKDDGNKGAVSRARESMMPEAANELRAPAADEAASADRDGGDGATPAAGRRSRTANKPPPVYNYSRRSTRKRSYDELEGTVSPTATSFNMASARTSRAPTPALPPAKKQRTGGPRVKESPKKNGSTTAGMPRATGEGSTSGIPNANRDQMENDEYCSSCGQNGVLVCCDNCSKSFHLECFDFVGSYQLPDEGPDEDWFCNECAFRRGFLDDDYEGAFAPLMAKLERTNPQAFSLPKPVQNRFENVKAGPNGEYQEIETAKHGKKEKSQDFDFHQQRDPEGNIVLCKGCEKAATSNRLILPCSICPYYWHLDCLDPPMAHPPNPKKWICPCHVDNIFINNPPLGPAHKYRKIRNAAPVDLVYRRGGRNNGLVEIYDDEESSGEDNSGWRDVKTYGRVHRLPASGVKLDFIEQLCKQRGTRGARARAPASVAESSAAATSPRVETTSLSMPPGSGCNQQSMPAWGANEASAAIGLYMMSTVAQPLAARQPVPNYVEDAESAVSILKRVQTGIVSRESLTAAQKQALKEHMDLIKGLLVDDADGDKTQDSIAHTDLASDGAASTRDASEEATTPKADAAVETPATEAAADKAAEAVKAGDGGELRIVDDAEDMAPMPAARQSQVAMTREGLEMMEIDETDSTVDVSKPTETAPEVESSDSPKSKQPRQIGEGDGPEGAATIELASVAAASNPIKTQDHGEAANATQTSQEPSTATSKTNASEPVAASADSESAVRYDGVKIPDSEDESDYQGPDGFKVEETKSPKSEGVPLPAIHGQASADDIDNKEAKVKDEAHANQGQDSTTGIDTHETRREESSPRAANPIVEPTVIKISSDSDDGHVDAPVPRRDADRSPKIPDATVLDLDSD